MAIKYFCDVCGTETTDSSIKREFVSQEGKRFLIELLVKNIENNARILCTKCACDIIESGESNG